MQLFLAMLSNPCHGWRKFGIKDINAACLKVYYFATDVGPKGNTLNEYYTTHIVPFNAEKVVHFIFMQFMS